jgi:hypothetical protein
LKHVHHGVGLLQGMFGAPVHFVRSPQVRLQVSDLALEGLAPLLVPPSPGQHRSWRGSLCDMPRDSQRASARTPAIG